MGDWIFCVKTYRFWEIRWSTSFEQDNEKSKFSKNTLISSKQPKITYSGAIFSHYWLFWSKQGIFLKIPIFPYFAQKWYFVSSLRICKLSHKPDRLLESEKCVICSFKRKIHLEKNILFCLITKTTLYPKLQQSSIFATFL